MADNPDVLKRLAQSIESDAEPKPQQEFTPEMERRFNEAAFSRAVQTGDIDLSDPNTRARLDPEARAFVERRIKEQREEAERQRVLKVLRRYWYGPDVIERVAGSVGSEGEGSAPLPVEAVPQADVGAANSYTPPPKPRPHGGYR